MSSLTAILSTLIISGSVFSFLPDNPNSQSVPSGELFLPPISANYNNGFSVSLYKNSARFYGEDDLLFLELGKSFAFRRWYLGNNIWEVGGAVGFKHYLSNTMPSASLTRELIPAGTDYIVANHIGFLLGSLIFRLSWEYESKESSRQFIDYITNKPTTDPQRQLVERLPDRLAGDKYEFILADVRSRFRYYVGLGAYSSISPRIDKRLARYGFDYRGGSNEASARLLVGAEHSSYEYTNWRPVLKASIGVEKSTTPLNAWRILLTWQQGTNNFGPYISPNEESTLVGIKTTLVF